MTALHPHDRGSADTRPHKLVIHAMGAAAVNIWLTLIALLTTPYVLLGLGTAAYGVFALVSVVSSHLSNLEFGFGHATVRFLARARGAGDRAAERAVLDTSLLVFLLGGTVAAMALFAATPYLTHSFFRIPSDVRPSAQNAFRMGALILFASFLSNFFYSVLQGLGQSGWYNGSRAVLGSLASAASVAVVALGLGLDWVFAVQCILSVAGAAVLGLSVARARGEWVRPRVERPILREMGTYGGFLFLGGLAYQLMINGPPMVLAAHVSSAEVPFFSVPHTIFHRFALLVGSASLGFFPFASAASSGTDRSHLAAVFRSHVRMTILVAMPVVACVIVFAGPLLQQWISAEFATAAAPSLRLLMAAALLLALSSPPADVARGLGHPRWVLVYTGSVAVLGVGLSLVTASEGPTGVALAVLLSLLFTTVPFVVLVARRLLGMPPRSLLVAILGPALSGVALTAAFAASASLVETLPWMLASSATLTASYGVLVFAYVLEPRERDTLRRAFGRL